nr:hypothetical protein [Janibacter limosus]
MSRFIPPAPIGRGRLQGGLAGLSSSEMDPSASVGSEEAAP